LHVTSRESNFNIVMPSFCNLCSKPSIWIEHFKNKIKSFATPQRRARPMIEN
jgi:hypothetical protein